MMVQDRVGTATRAREKGRHLATLLLAVVAGLALVPRAAAQETPPQTPPRSAQKGPPQQLTAPPSAGSTIATVRTPAPPTPGGGSPGGKRLHTSLAEFVLAMRNTPLGGASPRAAGSRSDIFVD